MADFMEHENFNDFKHGGYNGDNEDMVDNEDFFVGGAKDVKERSFTVEKASIGSFTGGRFIATSAYNAAKKAATAVFRHIDVESGVTKPRKQAATTKNGRDVVVNRSLAQKYTKKNPVSEVNFVLHRIDRQNAQKYYAYTAQRIRAERPVVIKRGSVTVSFNFTITVKPSILTSEYKSKNDELSKEFNAAKRAAKRKAENADKPRKPKAPKAKAAKAKAAKAPKAPKAPKAAKAPKAPKAAKKITVEEIIKSLSVPIKVKKTKAPKAKAPKAPKAKAPKAHKSPKAKTGKASRKALFGGSSCSFF